MAGEPLVLWAWSPGTTREGADRAPPPISHGEFTATFKQWIEAGARCPEDRAAARPR